MKPEYETSLTVGSFACRSLIFETSPLKRWLYQGPAKTLAAVVVFLASMTTCGCKPPQHANTSAQQTGNSATADLDHSNAARTTLPANATPTEVARAALQAISANDQKAFQSLIAEKKVREDLEAITRGRASFQGMVDKGVATSAKAIMVEINWLDDQGREVEQELITGSTALVTVRGTRAGQSMTRRIFLVLEDNQWRLVPSHR